MRAAPRLGTLQLTALLVVSHAPLVLLWVVMPAGWAIGDVVATPLVYLLAGLVLFCYVVSYRGLGRRIRHSGGLYAQVTYGLGPVVGFGTAVLFFVCYLAIAAGFYGLLARVLKALASGVFDIALPLPVALVIGLAGVLASTRLSLRAVAWISLVVAVEQLVGVLWFDLIAITSPAGGSVSVESLDPGWLLSGSFAVALVFAVINCVGSEVGTSYSTELADPARSIPRATFLAYALTTLVLAFSAWAVSVAVGAENAAATPAQGQTLVPALLVQLAGGGPQSLIMNLL